MSDPFRRFVPEISSSWIARQRISVHVSPLHFSICRDLSCLYGWSRLTLGGCSKLKRIFLASSRTLLSKSSSFCRKARPYIFSRTQAMAFVPKAVVFWLTGFVATARGYPIFWTEFQSENCCLILYTGGNHWFDLLALACSIVASSELRLPQDLLLHYQWLHQDNLSAMHNELGFKRSKYVCMKLFFVWSFMKKGILRLTCRAEQHAKPHRGASLDCRLHSLWCPRRRGTLQRNPGGCILFRPNLVVIVCLGQIWWMKNSLDWTLGVTLLYEQLDSFLAC